MILQFSFGRCNSSKIELSIDKLVIFQQKVGICLTCRSLQRAYDNSALDLNKKFLGAIYLITFVSTPLQCICKYVFSYVVQTLK